MLYYPDDKKKLFQYHLGNLHYINEQASVACFHMPYPYQDDFETKVVTALATYKRILILVTEMHPSTISFVRRFDNPAISYFFCGSMNNHLTQAQEHEFLDWVINTVYFYKDIKPDVLNALQPYSVKPFYFDALLGRRKPHRGIIWHYLDTHLKGRGIVTYINNTFCSFDKNDSQQWVWERDGLEIDAVPRWTVEEMTYYGHRMSLSQIVPIKVYNQSVFSIVAETNADDDYVFFTEKTVKPILGKRLFLMSGCQYSLAKLRDLGFKTFDSIIDETYDSIANFYERNALMLEQVKELCRIDQQTIIEQAKPIVEYNFNHLMTTNWYGRFIKEFAPYFA